DLSGNGVTNSSLISTDLVFMVGPGCPQVKLTGGTDASFAIYAPNSDVTITGGSDIYGAVVGKTVDASGGADIHYDRALANLSIGNLTCETHEISRAQPVVASLSSGAHVV